MAARSKARKRALDILFESEIRGVPVLQLLDERVAAASPPVAPYAADLVRGVQARRDQIDELLAEYAQGWTLERMPAVDRNILRIGAFELLWQDGVPDPVAINEAVQLARDLSTGGSPAFVNGLLARLLQLKPELTADPDAPESATEPETVPRSPAESELAEPEPTETGTGQPAGAAPGAAEAADPTRAGAPEKAGEPAQDDGWSPAAPG